MSDLKISEAVRAYTLLKTLWDAPKMAEHPTWQQHVFELLGPSDLYSGRVHPGDTVKLLVDGIRSQFKGERGIVVSGNESYAVIRVPGKVVPGETGEYDGPYTCGQFSLVKRGHDVV